MRILCCKLSILCVLLLPVQALAARHYYHLDRLGSVQMVTDEAGSRVESVVHEPYGTAHAYQPDGDPLLGSTGAFGFTGHRSVDASGLIYMNARYYDPALGLFVSHDLARQYPNPYSYADGDPLNGSDPSGRVFVAVPLVLLAANATSLGIASAEFLIAPSAGTAAALASEFVNPVPFAKHGLKLGSQAARRIFRGVTIGGKQISPAQIKAAQREVPLVLSRGDARFPYEIEATGGFKPRGSNTELLMDSCSNRGSVCASMDPSIAREFAAAAGDHFGDGKNSFLYFFRRGRNVLEVDKLLPREQLMRLQISGQKRVDSVGGINPQQVIGAVHVDVETKAIRDFFLNESLLP